MTDNIFNRILFFCLNCILRTPLSYIIPDKIFLYIQFRYRTKCKLNLKNPISFNEKIQWLKLYDRKPEYTIMSDKYEVRNFIRDKIGEKYLIPLIDVYETFDDIKFDTLPEQFVIKCTHDSGSILFCRDKQSFNIKKARNYLSKALKTNYFYHGREWAYKNIKPRIIVEKYMVDESGTELKDYKLFCFNGEPKLIQVDFERFANHKRNFYTPDWEYVNIINDCPPNPDIDFEKPLHLSLMLDLSVKLSVNIPLLRVDFYSIYDKILLGELTFYDGNGMNSYEPPEWNTILGQWLKLPYEI